MKSAHTAYGIALLCALGSLLTSWTWAYLIPLFVSLPLGLVSLLLWRRARTIQPAHRLDKVVLGLLIAGLALCLGSLLVVTLHN
ncbi:MAG: hypothetical protein ACKOCB_11155 [Planctomycetia bacterium]